MPNLKKPLAFFSIISLLLISGFGCKGVSKELKQATKPIVLEYWTVYDDVEALRTLVSAYTAQRTYLTVNIRQLRSDEIYNRFVEELADDKGPDIISVNTRSLSKYISRLQPMPPSVKDTKLQVIKGQMSDKVDISMNIRRLPNENDIVEKFVQPVKKDAVKGGRIYGLPLSFDVMALYYNKDLLDRAGIPEPPKDWEEFQKQVKILTKFDKASGKIIQSGAALGTGANIPGSSDLLFALYGQSSLAFVTDRAVFNAPKQNIQRGQNPADRVMDFYTGFANPERDTYSWNESMPNALDSFVNGSLAFFFGYNYQMPIIKGRAPQLNFDVVPMLQLTDESRVVASDYWLQAVALKSKHPNEAWGLVDYLTNSAAVKQYLDLTGRPTALRIYVGAQKEKPELEPFVSQLLVADTWYRGRDFEAADKAIQQMFKEWIQPVSDDKLVEWRQSVLERAAAKVNQTL